MISLSIYLSDVSTDRIDHDISIYSRSSSPSPAVVRGCAGLVCSTDATKETCNT